MLATVVLAVVLSQAQCVQERARQAAANVLEAKCFRSVPKGARCPGEAETRRLAEAEVELACSWTCAFASRIAATTRESYESARSGFWKVEASGVAWWRSHLELDDAKEVQACAQPRRGAPATADQAALIRAYRFPKEGERCVLHTDEGYVTSRWTFSPLGEGGWSCGPGPDFGRSR